MTKNLIFALPKHATAGITAKTCSGRANIEFFAIFSETLQVVLTRFWGRTNIDLMFLFPCLDWCIDILDFEKIDFLSHEPFLAFSAPPKTHIFTKKLLFVGSVQGGRNFFMTRKIFSESEI